MPQVGYHYALSGKPYPDSWILTDVIYENEGGVLQSRLGWDVIIAWIFQPKTVTVVTTANCLIGKFNHMKWTLSIKEYNWSLNFNLMLWPQIKWKCFDL